MLSRESPAWTKQSQVSSLKYKTIFRKSFGMYFDSQYYSATQKGKV